MPSLAVLLMAGLGACGGEGEGTITPPPADDDDAAPTDDDDLLDDDDSASIDDDDSASIDDDDSADDDDSGDDDDSLDPVVTLFINEVLADNTGSSIDEEGLASDWFEIHNPGTVPLHLSGFTVSDTWSEPALYTLPSGLVVPAGGFLVLWADGESDPEGAHVPFRLAAAGEAVGLFDPHGRVVDWVEFPELEPDQSSARLPDGGESWSLASPATPGLSNVVPIIEIVPLIEVAATWRLLDTGVDPDPTWTDVGFDDAEWPEGVAPLGYGDPMTTLIDYGPDPTDKHITTWFRHEFEVEETAAMGATSATITLRVDDGALVRLNGEELVRVNLPAGPIDSSTLATLTQSGSGETAYGEYLVPAPTLLVGTNALAVEVHQVVPNSSDLGFDLGLSVQVESEAP